MKVSCVGCGTIGRSWALLFASKGFEVNLYDINPNVLKDAQNYIRTHFNSLTVKIKTEMKTIEETMGNIRLSVKLEEAVKDIDYVQESIIENLDYKKKLFREISSMTKPQTIIASSTSGLSMTEIQKNAIKPERCIIVHPINPPHMIPLVEIVPGEETSTNVVDLVYELMIKLEKVPIKLGKETPGFIINRLSAALWREALDLLDKNISTVEDIDKAITAGIGLRWAIMGPFLTYHLGGGKGGLEHFIDHLGPAFSSWWNSMETWTSIPPSATKKAIEGIKHTSQVKAKTNDELVKWRDKRLMKLIEVLFQPA